MPEGLGSFFQCEIRTSSFLKVRKHRCWGMGKKAVASSGFANTPKLVTLSKLLNMKDAHFPHL